MAKQPVILHRRRKLPSSDMVLVQTRVTAEQSELLTTVAINAGRSKSAQVAMILEQWLAKNIK